MNRFYYADTEAAFGRVAELLKNEGFVWVGLNNNPTFTECKKRIHGNAKLIIHAFVNDINKRKEIQFGTMSIYNTYPQFKGQISLIYI